MKDFSELKGLRDKLQEDERVRAIEQAVREKRERIARERAVEFRSAVEGVHKIPESDRYVYRPVYVASERAFQDRTPRTEEEETEAVLRESLSDLFDVAGLLDEDPSLSYAREGVGPDVVRKLRKRHWPVQDELDLHGMNRDQAREAVTGFLHSANRRHARCVRIVHGIGYGSPRGEPVLRGIVHSWLVQKSDVIAFCVAGKKDGGHGALIVLLRAALSEEQ